MSNINISGLEPIDDPEYRYKMPRVLGKVEGRGNGIKTVIPNIVELANALHREPAEVCKFFGCELGAQTTWRPEAERAIVNGAHTDTVLQQLVHKYIELFVLCPNCHLPESSYKIKNGIILHKCLACGAKDPVDMAHKLTTFILSNDKKNKKSKKDKDGKDKKKDKRDKDKKKDKRDKEKKKEKREKEDDASAEPNADAGREDSFGECEEEAATLDNLEVDDSSAFDNCVISIRRFVEDNAPANVLLEELRTAQTFSAFPLHYRIHLYVAAVMEGSTTVTVEQVKSISPVFRQLRQGPKDERHLLGGFELLCVKRAPALKAFFPVILKFLYDADMVEEETILSWAKDDGITEYTCPGVAEEDIAELKKRAQPFLTWLEEVSSSRSYISSLQL
ncbi:unnamed protein product [Chrysoparadoxa australica]